MLAGAVYSTNVSVLAGAVLFSTNVSMLAGAVYSVNVSMLAGAVLLTTNVIVLAGVVLFSVCSKSRALAPQELVWI